jgi:hypothetical protein
VSNFETGKRFVSAVRNPPQQLVAVEFVHGCD